MARRPGPKPPAAKAVFINCPFDDAFKPLLRAMVFAIIASGYYPRCALDKSDSAEVRVSKIAGMIGECDWGIHDLSRVEVGAGGLRRSFRIRPYPRRCTRRLLPPWGAPSTTRCPQAVLTGDGTSGQLQEWLGRFTSMPRTRLIAAKRAIVEGSRLSLSEGLRLEQSLFLRFGLAQLRPSRISARLLLRLRSIRLFFFLSLAFTPGSTSNVV